jgi:hypothetical protein
MNEGGQRLNSGARLTRRLAQMPAPDTPARLAMKETQHVPGYRMQARTLLTR